MKYIIVRRVAGRDLFMASGAEWRADRVLAVEFPDPNIARRVRSALVAQGRAAVGELSIVGDHGKKSEVRL